MKYEEYVLLEYVLSARDPVTAEDVLEHLVNSVDGFGDRQGQDGGKRNVQQRLKSLVECENFSRLIEAQRAI